MCLESLNVSPRIIRCLRAAGVGSIETLVALPVAEVARIPGIGKLSFRVLSLELERRGLAFRDGIRNVEGDPAKLRIEEIGLTARALHALMAAGVVTVGDLLRYPENLLKRIPNLGPKSFHVVVRELRRLGFSLSRPNAEEAKPTRKLPEWTKEIPW